MQTSQNKWLSLEVQTIRPSNCERSLNQPTRMNKREDLTNLKVRLSRCHLREENNKQNTFLTLIFDLLFQTTQTRLTRMLNLPHADRKNSLSSSNTKL